MNTEVIKLDTYSQLHFYPTFLKEAKSRSLFTLLQSETDWQQGEIKIFGKKIKEPRLTFFEADQGVSYKYSNRLNTGSGWSSHLKSLKKKIEVLSGQRFNSVLMNYYRNQNDSMGWHRDNEKELGANPVVASLSLGEQRVFWFRRYKDKTRVTKIVLPSGSLLLMLGRTQHDWEHCIKKQSQELGGRINLTFRNIIL